MPALRTVAKSRTFQLAAIVTASATVTALLFSLGVLDSWQEKILDRFFIRKEAPHTIVIVAIDEQSIAQSGAWPWPRALFSKLIETISGASAVGLDVTLSEPSRLGPQDDSALADTLARMPDRVVLPMQLRENGDIVTRPLDSFVRDTRLGFVNITPDADGVVRHARRNVGEYPNFAEALAIAPETPEINHRIDYHGPEKTFLTIPASEVLRGTIPKRILKDAIVLIGVTAPSLHDTVLTPFGVMPGVELHANTIATLAAGKFFTEHSLPWGVGAIILVHALLLVCVLYFRRFAYLAVSLGGVFILLFIGSLVMFAYYIVPPIAYLAGGYGLAVFATLSFQYVTESKEKRFIRNSFQYYLTPHVIDELLRDPVKLKLGGEQKKITIFFSDIRSFTTISEGLTPTQLTHLLNEYLTAMTDIVMDERGVVDKYIGDAIMAFWGAPLPNPAQARDACEAAVKMSRTLKELNTAWAGQGLPPLHIGMGINTGDVVVGNMGSLRRFNYTLMGDDVNFASRLEGLTKYYKTECLISKSVQQEIVSAPELVVRELDTVIVKGKKEPKKIFALVTQPISNASRRAMEIFERGRLHYVNGEWAAATEAFGEAIAIADDGPSHAFLERTKELKQNPPPDWNGIYEFTSK